jgi:hypothetical protein
MRNGRFEFRYWWAYCFDFVDGMRVSDVPQPFVESDTDRRFPLQVGKHMYAGGKDGWWISTKIVSIEGELDEPQRRL